jgi:glycerol-3-phosphate dehydrogenase
MQTLGTVDLLIIGGGINGVGIARDAAGRGLSVMLCEQNDLASATSSASSKLIHGGLRYLEYYDFHLVRESLAEREVLLAMAPHLVRPLRFVLPHRDTLRPAWMIRLGLWLYDHLGRRRRLPGSHGLNLRTAPEGIPLQPSLHKGFVYADCWVDDARLVILNALDAAQRGAAILTRTKCIAARRLRHVWDVRLYDTRSNTERGVQARILVNAAGPWVQQVLEHTLGVATPRRLRLVKGSHIVVPRLYTGDQAYILQNLDRRVVFVLPFEGRFSLIGTTDVPFEGEASAVHMEAVEATYLCEAVNRYFACEIAPSDIIWSYAGVRALLDDGSDNPSAVTRDYALEVDAGGDKAPLLSVFGGKLTTYRKLAERALHKLRPYLPFLRPAWTSMSPLPGGDLPDADFDRFLADFQRTYSWLPPEVATRYAHCYGTRAVRLLEGAQALADLGRHFGASLYQREVEYLIATEWAMTAEDILWRRTKQGLHMPPDAAATLQAWLASGGKG